MVVSGFQIIGFGLACMFMFIGVTILAYFPTWIGLQLVKQENKRSIINLKLKRLELEQYKLKHKLK